MMNDIICMHQRARACGLTSIVQGKKLKKFNKFNEFKKLKKFNKFEKFNKFNKFKKCHQFNSILKLSQSDRTLSVLNFRLSFNPRR